MKTLIVTALLAAIVSAAPASRSRYGSQSLIVGRGAGAPPQKRDVSYAPAVPHQPAGYSSLNQRNLGNYNSDRPPIYLSSKILGIGKPCHDSDEVRNSDGSCGVPEVSRKIYVFASKQKFQAPILQPAPEPEVNIDVILVKTPEAGGPGEPIVVPPPEQKTVVYVLSKRPEVKPEIIEVPSDVQEPEVYFVNYDDGENPTLPGGIDLRTALSQSNVQSGGIIGSNSFDHGSGNSGTYGGVPAQPQYSQNRYS